MDEQIPPTLIFFKTLMLLGSVTILYTAPGGSPTSTFTLRLQREPFGTLTLFTNVREDERREFLFSFALILIMLTAMRDYATEVKK
jgi:hypothetical protein